MGRGRRVALAAVVGVVSCASVKGAALGCDLPVVLPLGPTIA